MPDGILSSFDGSFLWLLLIGLALYLGFRMVTGFHSHRKIMGSLSAEGLLRCQRWVLMRMKFPLIRRITFSHVYLSEKRFILFHFLTRGLILQAPLGPLGKPGREKGAAPRLPME